MFHHKKRDAPDSGHPYTLTDQSKRRQMAQKVLITLARDEIHLAERDEYTS